MITKKTKQIINKIWANPFYFLGFYLIVGLCLGMILKLSIGFYIIDGIVGSDYFFIDWANNDYSLIDGY